MCTQGDAYKIQDLLAEPRHKATLNFKFKIKCFMSVVSNTNKLFAKPLGPNVPEKTCF